MSYTKNQEISLKCKSIFGDWDCFPFSKASVKSICMHRKSSGPILYIPSGFDHSKPIRYFQQNWKDIPIVSHIISLAHQMLSLSKNWCFLIRFGITEEHSICCKASFFRLPLPLNFLKVFFVVPSSSPFGNNKSKYCKMALLELVEHVLAIGHGRHVLFLHCVMGHLTTVFTLQKEGESCETAAQRFEIKIYFKLPTLSPNWMLHF